MSETSAPSRIRTTQALVIVGGAAMAVGSLLPWATATHVFGQTRADRAVESAAGAPQLRDQRAERAPRP